MLLCVATSGGVGEARLPLITLSEFLEPPLYTGDTKTIHMQLTLKSVGGRYEYVSKDHYTYPSFNKHPLVKVDVDDKSHQSYAIGSLTISGGFQYINASQYGEVGIGTSRNHTITRE